MGTDRISGVFKAILIFAILAIFGGCGGGGGGGGDETNSENTNSPQTSEKIPDTGQMHSVLSTFGEDADYTGNTPSYTKLDSNGAALANSENQWAMVKDNITGLIWEGKTDDGSIHDKDNTYAFDNIETDFIDILNKTNFGGYSDWRLPTSYELITIIDYSRADPAINTNYFINTMIEQNNITKGYLTSDVQSEASNLKYMWLVYYLWGGGNEAERSFTRQYVRAVHGNNFVNNFVDNGDGTVSDLTTGLMWMKQKPKTLLNWEDAIKYCENLSYAGYEDWRLPNIKQLASILNLSASNHFLKNNSPGSCWSSTYYQYYSHINSAWIGSFSPGGVCLGRPETKDQYSVLPVRIIGPVKTNNNSNNGNVTPVATGQWKGNWLLINFLSDEDNGVWDEDDTTGIGESLVVTDTTWTEYDNNSTCSVTYSYSVNNNLEFVNKFVSATGDCGFEKTVDETGHLEFSDDNTIMIQYWDLVPGDEIYAFKWMRK
jgi:hypothetical protein